MFEKLDMIIIHVHNIKISGDYYRNILGLPQLEKKDDWQSFKLGDSVLGIQPWHSGTEDERTVKYGATIVTRIDDVNKRLPELEAKGAHILVDPHDEPWGRAVEIVDPDGYIILLYSK
ncbi:VOC family protein [candidate division KSB1 bacterium]|nr:VOC family protein [candidate division KSB1 bacterium]